MEKKGKKAQFGALRRSPGRSPVPGPPSPDRSPVPGPPSSPVPGLPSPARRTFLCLELAVAVLAITACGATERVPAAPIGPPQTIALPGGVAGAPAAADPVRPRHQVGGNLLQNASFEDDFHNRKFAEERRFLLLQASDLGTGEADGEPDHWPGLRAGRRAAAAAAWDAGVARSGHRSLRFEGAGRLQQRLRLAGEQHWQAGGAHYAKFLPMAANLAAQVPKRPLVVGGWCKTEGVPAGSEPRLVATVECAERPGYENTRRQGRPQTLIESVAFSGGAHGWEYRELRLDPSKAPGPFFLVSVSVETRHRTGTVWFDDLSCVEPVAEGSVNLAPNPDFESVDAAGWLTGWRKPETWRWFRNEYYTWTGWSHASRSEQRGGAAVDPQIAYHGGRSVRFTVFPGDNFSLESDAVALDQQAAHPLEVRLMVRADNLRTLELMAKDERGEWLPQGDFLGDDMENNPGTYDMGTTGSGTYDWQCVRKYFSPRRPLKSVRLFLCARGFDGAILNRNLVGTVWMDGLQLFEHGGAKRTGDGGPGTGRGTGDGGPTGGRGLRLADLDLGDRLWGRNRVRVTFSVPDEAAKELATKSQVTSACTARGGQPVSTNAPIRLVDLPAAEGGTVAVADVPYAVERLCSSWKEQYTLSLQLLSPGSAARSLGTYSFGTPARLLETGVSGYFLYPEEQVTLFARINASRQSLALLDRCEFQMQTPDGAKKIVTSLKDLTHLADPQFGPDNENSARLVQHPLGSDGVPVHPWTDPARDLAFTARLFARGAAEKPLTESGAVRFGFMEPPPKFTLPAKIERTAVNAGGWITVNGEPYFPVYWTPHFGMVPEANYPPNSFGGKTADLTQLVCGSGKAPDAAVKEQVLRKVAELKQDPKFFQYELGDGEMQLQGMGWQQRVAWLKTAAAWIREADPDHLINGPQSWLVGHPGHNQAMQAFVPDWDVIGVEASFEEQPEVDRYLGPLMKTKKTATLVGLETYFYQSPETLRWRGYTAMLNGARGIGLCPSGMMQAKPALVNHLRGLNAEFRALGPVFMAPEPAKRSGSSSPLVSLIERTLGGKRFLVAIRTGGEGPLTARFTLPSRPANDSAQVRFEGRTVKLSDSGFSDEFNSPRTVHVYQWEE